MNEPLPPWRTVHNRPRKHLSEWELVDGPKRHRDGTKSTVWRCARCDKYEVTTTERVNAGMGHERTALPERKGLLPHQG